MTVTTDTNVSTNGDTATVSGRFTLKNLPVVKRDELAKPLFAYVGAADLALEQARVLPSRAEKVLAEVPVLVKGIPAQVKEIRGEVEVRVAKVSEQATDLYAKLAVRGERIVTQIRRQPATEAAIAEGKEAVRKAEASATAARKATKAGEKAVEDAASKIG